MKWLMKQQIVIQYIIQKCNLKCIIIKYYNKLTLRTIYKYCNLNCNLIIKLHTIILTINNIKS